MLIRTTILEPHIRIRVKRTLPIPGEVITGVGQTVNPMQTVARATQYTRYRILPLSDILQISPAKLLEMLEIQPGARIKQGATLVDKKGFLGRRTQYESPIDGEVYEINNGRLILRQTSEIFELRALVAGNIVEQIPRRGVILETFGSLIQAVWSNKQEDAGLLKTMSFSPDAMFFPEQITSDEKSAILVVGWFDQAEVLESARQAGVRGIIAGSITADMCKLAEQVDLPVIVTDGIGVHGMSAPVFDILQAADGRRTAMLGGLPGASAERPQIVIQADKKTTDSASEVTNPLVVGQKVRLVRAPHLNKVAEVHRLYHLAQTTGAGIKAPGADVRLENGQIVFVPYANMEAII